MSLSDESLLHPLNMAAAALRASAPAITARTIFRKPLLFIMVQKF